MFQVILNIICLKGPNPNLAVTFATTSTKNPREHLRLKHRIDADGVIATSGSTTHQETIQAAFGRAGIPKIEFNADVFKHLMVRWVFKMSITFRVCDDDTFRAIPSYLAACVSTQNQSCVILVSLYDLRLTSWLETRLHGHCTDFTS
jgi:hypothetical protein